VLVILGVNERGEKQLVSLNDGYRESEESWLEMLRDLKDRGLQHEPQLAIADGALGFWKALPKVFPHTRQQRCWQHKTINILDKFPKSMKGKVTEKLHNIWMAETKSDAQKALKAFVKSYEEKYPRATECLLKDEEQLLTFYDFPAAHWRHYAPPIRSSLHSPQYDIGHRELKDVCLVVRCSPSLSSSSCQRHAPGTDLQDSSGWLK
jgi:transposase-like protein